MSRDLPEKPNFQFLRKQAKELLRTMPEATLAQAQLALARDYGFSSWARLKAHVEELALGPAQALKAAVCASDAARVRALLSQHADLRARIDDPMPDYGFGQHALFAAVQRSDRETIAVLLEAGANIHKRTEWWAGGFGLLDDCDPDLVDFLVERGAVVDAHAAARLGRLDRLRELVGGNPDLVHARGGDGQTPLHFAASVEIAEWLLAQGADIDARDIDHESTPAQYMLRVDQKRHYRHDRQDVARYLVARGCGTDLLMAAALGDLELVRHHLDRDPSAIRMSVSPEWFPMQNPRAGGSIYIWMLGKHRTAHAVARDFGHEDVFSLLVERTPQDLKLTLACELGDRDVFRDYLAAHPRTPEQITEQDRSKLPDAAQNNNVPAVRLMLEAGWPVDTLGEMGATALHWAGFHGNAEMTRAILPFAPDLMLKSVEYAGTALSWALFGSGNGWHSDTGDYVGTIQALLDAGAVLPPHPESLEPSDAVLEMLP